jgi:DNA-binding NtrC family response regulator
MRGVMAEPKVAVAVKDDGVAGRICSLVNLAGARCVRLLPDQALDDVGQEAEELHALVVNLEDWNLNRHYFKQLEAMRPDLKAIVLSRSGNHPDLKDAVRSNIFSFLHLPLEEEELAFCLRSVIRAATRREGPG